MYSEIHAAVGIVARISSVATAILCLIEIVITVRYIMIMVKHKLNDKEPVIYSGMILILALLIMLGTRNTIYGLMPVHVGSIHVVFNIMPVIILIYFLRVVGRYIWLKEIVQKHYLHKIRTK